ncbi:MAG: ribonuclease H-like domain-containing protein [Candidatus Limnocylindrales bacterium]
MTDAALLERRLARFRLARPSGTRSVPDREAAHAALARSAEARAERLADALDGSWVQGAGGGHVRIEPPSIGLPVDRDRCAGLPGHPGPDVPLVCLDTETTGLATGAGTLAFLVGLGWWEADRFRQVQLLLPDEAGEAGLLGALADLLPPDAWLVTYNGRGFDWPLLVSRYRLNRLTPPPLAGHLDLLPFVRRVFRHRLSDARLKTVEVELLGMRRGHDIEGWQIPGQYLAMLRGGPIEPITEIVRHNHEDVRSLGRLLAHSEQHLGAASTRRSAPAGDLFGLARAYHRFGRDHDALDCLDAALEGPPRPAAPFDRGPHHATPLRRSWTAILTTRADARDPVVHAPARLELIVERARLLRRLGRHHEALEAWRDVAHAGGPEAALAWIEVAKCLEHRERDPGGALDACALADRLAQRSRLLGRPLRGIEADLGRRRRRLNRRLATRPGGR